MKAPGLFSDEPPPPATSSPLAERLRPTALDEFVGQTKVLGVGTPLREAIESDRLQSLILWGPPGTGKTTLARLIAARTGARFVAFSAVLSGIKEIKAIMAEAELVRRQSGRRTIVFVDEIHRFNKSQQDAFLPRVENGDIVLIGATTENPSFEVNSALLSRSKVYVFEPLGLADLVTLVRRALEDERGLAPLGVRASDAALQAIATYANGDARVALNTIELAATTVAARATTPDGNGGARIIDIELASHVTGRRGLRYDKSGEEHFALISALHKSMRNSDPDASVYWLARMIESGEDPLYIARRLVRFASEDVGNADPHALSLAVAAKDAVHFMGMPEGNTALAQAAIYLACAPKSNAVYRAYQEAAADASHRLAEPVPLHLRNAPTELMRAVGYGQGYRSAHDDASGTTDMTCLPPELEDRRYYQPSGRGDELAVGERLARLREERSRAGKTGSD